MMSEFESNIIGLYGERGKAWLKNLQNIVGNIADKFGLSELKPVPNLSYHYVLSGFQGNAPIILKLGLDDNSLRQEAAALQAFAGYATIRALAQTEGMVLLERVVPGTSLKSYFPTQDNEALDIFSGIMKRLHQAPIPKTGFPNITDWLLDLDTDWEIPPPYLAKARKLRDHLLATSSTPALLHGDLHHDNILKSGNDWLVIDPKGVIGEPAYEIPAFIRNPIYELPDSNNATAIIENRIRFLSKTFNIERDRILGWCLVQAVLGWTWALEDKTNETPFRTLTRLFDGMLNLKVKEIKVTPYNLNWPKLFETEAANIKKALGKNCLAIHHIGSTAVPGLAAKPKIDIIATIEDPEKVIVDLEKAGYTYKGEWNIPFKYGFTKRGKLDVNLHVYEDLHPEIEVNLIFRDYLRSHPAARNEYAALKESLLENASSFQKTNSMFSGYNLGKNAFINSILKEAGFNRIRFLKCTHHAEWDAAKRLRQTYFFDKIPIADPYTWTFNHPEHVHFVLYQGVEIIGYAHIQLWPNSRAALRIIVIDEPKRKQGLGKIFLRLIEKWLKLKGYQSLHTESSPGALAFYEQAGYIPLPFDDPNKGKTDPPDIPMGKLL